MSYKVSATCLKFSTLVMGLLIWLAGLSQAKKVPPPVWPEMDAFLLLNQKTLGNNLVAMTWKEGKIVYQKNFEKEAGDFNGKTQMEIGHASEWLTAALVMTYVDEGKLSLDDKVSKYIPIFATYMKSYITIRNCLTNTTGIQADAIGALKILQKSKFATLEDEVNSFASKREIQANPGMEVYYSHVGFNIAGRVLEIIAKKNFDRLMQDRIIHPLKMRGTSFTDESGGATNPSAGALSTPNDYLNFLAMLLDSGKFEGKRVLSEKSVQEMETLQFTELPVKSIPKGWEGWHTGLGDWINGNVICNLNLNGNWAYIDKCRKYAAILFVKNPTAEPRKEIYQRFQQTADARIGGNCE